MKLHQTRWGGPEGADDLNGKGDDLVNGSAQLELVAFGLKRHILQGCIGRRADVQIVADVPNIRVDDALLNPQDEGLGIIKGWIEPRVRANQLSANPSNVDTEVRAFAQEQIVRLDQRGIQVIGRGFAVPCISAESRVGSRGYRGGYVRPRTPEEQAEADDCCSGGNDDDGSAGTSHSAILVTFKGPGTPVAFAGLREELHTALRCSLAQTNRSFEPLVLSSFNLFRRRLAA